VHDGSSLLLSFEARVAFGWFVLFIALLLLLFFFHVFSQGRYV